MTLHSTPYTSSSSSSLRLSESNDLKLSELNGLHPRSQDGFTIIFAVLLVGIVLSMVFTLSAIFIPKIKSAGDTIRSVTATYAAESAIEWCLYVSRVGSVALPVMSNGAVLTNGTTGASFVSSDCLSSPIRAIGTFQGVNRSFEISF